MALYKTNDLAFELDEAFKDLTIHELDAPLKGPGGPIFSLLIERERFPRAAQGSAGTFGDAVQERVREDARRLPRHRVLDVRELRVAGRPEDERSHGAFAVVFEWSYRATHHYSRQLHVLVGLSHLCFSATVPFDHREACDQYFDHLIETLQLDAEERHGL